MDDTVAALEQSIADHLDIMPTHWVLVAASLDGAIHSVCSSGMPLWMRKGLLEWDATSYGAQPIWTLDEDEEED